MILGIVATLDGKLLERRARRAKLAVFIGALREIDGLLDGFDEGLFMALVDSVTVGRGGELTFKLVDGRVN